MKTNWSGGGVPYGYSYNKEINKLETNKEEKKVLQRIFTLASEGYGVQKIANDLNSRGITNRSGGKWSSTTITYMLHPVRLKFYCGIRDNERGNWEPLLSEQLFNKIPQHETLTQSSKKKINRKEFLLSGTNIFICGHCKGNVKASVTTRNNGDKQTKNTYYLCGHRQTRGISQCTSSKLHRQDTIDRLVLDDLKVQLSSKNAFFISEYITKLQNNLEDKIFNLVKESDDNLPLKENIKEENFIDSDKILENLREKLKEFSYFFSEDVHPIITPMLSFDDHRKAVVRNIRKIYLYSDRLEIFYKFPINKMLEFRNMFDLKKTIKENL